MLQLEALCRRFGYDVPWEVTDEPMTVTESGTMLVDRYPSLQCMKFVSMVQCPAIIYTALAKTKSCSEWKQQTTHCQRTYPVKPENIL